MKVMAYLEGEGFVMPPHSRVGELFHAMVQKIFDLWLWRTNDIEPVGTPSARVFAGGGKLFLLIRFGP
jgi:hypothetical protein